MNQNLIISGFTNFKQKDGFCLNTKWNRIYGYRQRWKEDIVISDQV